VGKREKQGTAWEGNGARHKSTRGQVSEIQEGLSGLHSKKKKASDPHAVRTKDTLLKGVDARPH
jgi:hypothetical protein